MTKPDYTHLTCARPPRPDPTLEPFWDSVTEGVRLHALRLHAHSVLRPAPQPLPDGASWQARHERMYPTQPQLPSRYVAHISDGPDGYAIVSEGVVLVAYLSRDQAQDALERYR